MGFDLDRHLYFLKDLLSIDRRKKVLQKMKDIER